MANTDNNTVQLTVSNNSPYIEGIVAAGITVTPGDLITLEATDTYNFAGATGEVCENTYAVENIYGGGDIDDTYAAGSKVMIRVLRNGDIFLAFLAPSLTVTIGEILVVTSDGALRQWTIGTEHPKAVSLESLTTGGTKGRIRVRIL